MHSVQGGKRSAVGEEEMPVSGGTHIWELGHRTIGDFLVS